MSLHTCAIADKIDACVCKHTCLHRASTSSVLLPGGDYRTSNNCTACESTWSVPSLRVNSWANMDCFLITTTYAFFWANFMDILLTIRVNSECRAMQLEQVLAYEVIISRCGCMVAVRWMKDVEPQLYGRLLTMIYACAYNQLGLCGI